MNAEEMWKRFIKTENIPDQKYDSWAFGTSPDALAQLVLTGKKTGTSSAWPLYKAEEEALPEAESYSIILDSVNEAVCVIQTTKVYITPFNDVSEEHAYKEGEGDRSLRYWRSVHKKFFTECLKEAGLVFCETMLVVCEEFNVVFSISHGTAKLPPA